MLYLPVLNILFNFPIAIELLTKLVESNPWHRELFRF